MFRWVTRTDTIRVVSMAVKCEDVRETDATDKVVFASGSRCHPLFECKLDGVGTRASASRPRSGLSRPPCAARMGAEGRKTLVMHVVFNLWVTSSAPDFK